MEIETAKDLYFIEGSKTAYRAIEVAKILRIRLDTLYKLYINTGIIPSKKVGKNRLIEHGNLVSFLRDVGGES